MSMTDRPPVQTPPEQVTPAFRRAFEDAFFARADWVKAVNAPDFTATTVDALESEYERRLVVLRSLSSQSPASASEGITDTQRLEWVMQEGHGVTSSSRHGWKAWTIRTGDSYGTTYREAIDAAMHSDTQRTDAAMSPSLG